MWLLRIPPDSPIGQLGLLLGAFGPAIAALIVRTIVTREGFEDAGLRPRFRANWRYYLFSYFWPFAIITSIAGLLVLTGTVIPQLYPSPTSLNTIRDLSGWISAMIGTLMYTPILFGEEFGWRSYLQIRLFSKNPLTAAIATGAIWGVWHWPALLTGQIPNQNGILGLLLFPWYTIWFSIVLGWLRLRTGSVWTASLAHSANNFILNASQVGLLLSFTGGLGDLLLSPSGVLFAAPVIVLTAWIVLTRRLEPAKTNTGLENARG